MKRLVALVISFVLCEVVGTKTTAQTKYTVYGSGTISCGKWTATTSRTLRNLDVAWVLGFVSGAGYTGIDLKHTDNDAMEKWVDVYCASHPLDDLALAAAQLVKALR